jgi:hypothetical protein
LQTIANTPRVATDPRLFCWDRRTLKRGTLHRKKLGAKGLNFSEGLGARARPAQYSKNSAAKLLISGKGRARIAIGRPLPPAA